MKARFLVLAAMMLGLASCQTEPEGLNVNVGGEVDTVVTVTIPETETRTGGNDSAKSIFDNGVLGNENDDKTMRYILEIYYKNELFAERLVDYSDGKTVTFPVRLVAGREYNFVVWADYVESKNDTDFHYNTKNKVGEHYYGLTNVTLNNNKWKAMDETRDAFTGFFVVDSYSGSKSINIPLIRPFAKLRVMTTDMEHLNKLGIVPTYATVEYAAATPHYNAFNAKEGKVNAESQTLNNVKHENFRIASYGEDVANGADMTLFTDYFFATGEEAPINFTLTVYDQNGASIENIIKTNNFYTPIPVRRNYLTTISGDVLTEGGNVKVTVNDIFAKPDIIETVVEVNNATEFQNAIENAENGEETVIVLGDDINLNDLISTLSTRAASTALTIANGKTISIDLNGKTLSATTTQSGGNQELFLVKGNLSIVNGNIEYEHVGENMGWGSMTTIFDVTAGGVLNLEGVTAKNLGGSDMNFVAHLNNWGEVTLNVENCTLEATYVPVRVFNSGYDMNNVTIKNSTLKGVSAAFWVHNYTEADFANTNTTAEKQKALLNLDIFDESNTFSPILGIRYGFTNPLRFDSYGITRSENAGVVTLGKLFGNGVVRRYVAGDENNTITKVIVGEGITVLENRTFRKFHALEEVVLPSTLTTIGVNGKGNDDTTGTAIFQGCENLKTIVIPESVKIIDKGAFYGCSSLESINIPTGITRIEESSLRATGLKSVEFHAGVTYFGTYAFRDCKQLTEVVINAPEFTMEGNTFGIMAAPFTPMTIYVANDEMKAYVESKLTAHDKTYITVKAPATVTDKASLQAAMAEAIKAGEKNIYIDGTNFSGDLNYGFSNANLPAGVTVTIRNAKVTATSKWNYLNGKLVFENCELTAGLYSIHFDDNDGVGDVVFKNCKLVGWLPFAAINSVTFEGCHLTGNGSYALIRSYANLTLKNCVIDTTLANHTDEYTDGVQAIAPATLTEENVTYIDNHTAYLQNVLKAGKHVVLSSDLTINEDEMMTAPYGNKMALHHNGGLFDGNEKTLSVTIGGDNYAVMTSGGTIKDLTIDNGFRGVLIMSPKETIYLENVVSGGEGVCYALNTAEGDSTQDLVATNCTFDGWCSWSEIKSATFTNCTFGQGTYYTNVLGRLGKPYVNTLYDGCNFCSKYYIDLSALKADQKVIVKNCTVNGVKITAENWTSLVAPEDTCGEGQISVELKNGTFLTAENVADYIVFE